MQRLLTILLLFTTFAFAGSDKKPVKVPEGTQILAVLTQSISSKSTKSGSPVELVTIADVVAPDNTVLIPTGAKLKGKVTEVQKLKSGEAAFGIWVEHVEWKDNKAKLEAFIIALGKMGARPQRISNPDAIVIPEAGSNEEFLQRSLANQQVNRTPRPAGAPVLVNEQVVQAQAGTVNHKRDEAPNVRPDPPAGLKLRRASSGYIGSTFSSTESEIELPLGTELLLRHGLPPAWRQPQN